MCKPVTIIVKDKVLQSLSCQSNGMKSKMDLCPSNDPSLSSNLVNNIDLKLERENAEINDNCFETEGCSWKTCQEDDETSLSFQGAVADDSQNNKLFRIVEDISTVVNVTPSINRSLEENLINFIRPDSKAIVDDLIEKINQLSIIQKMLLYLKLPAPSEDPDQGDPLRRPLNPLGNRQEVSQALAYIRTHFQPDPDVSLPKKEIYNEYVSFCSNQKTKPLSTADFGKAMKQVYPVVRPRRLGERGNSRYCYSGLCNRNELEKPRTPSAAQARDAVSRKICVWASKILNVRINNLTELSNLIPSEPHSNVTDSEDKTGGSFQFDGLTMLEGKKRKIELENTQNEEPRLSKQKKTSRAVKGQRTCGLKSSKPVAGTSSAQSLKGETKASAAAGPSNDCDNTNQKQIDVDMFKKNHLVVNSLDLKPEKSTNVGKKKKSVCCKKSPVKKPQRAKKKGVPMSVDYNSVISPKKTTLDTIPMENGFTIASIEEDLSSIIHSPSSTSQPNQNGSNSSPSNSMNFSRSEEMISSERNFSCDSIKVKNLSETCNTRDCDQSDNYNDMGYLTTESLGHYFQDEGNSQEPEEELLKYFKDPVKSDSNNFSQKDTSQLRLLLEQNMPEDTSMIYDRKFSGRDTGFSEDDSMKPKEISMKSYLTSPQESPQKSSFLPTLHSSSTKRRVSFENIPDSFPQSPNTFSKNFSFTPISPRPPTVSKSMVSVSPFVFPRDTVFRGKLSTANNGNHHTSNPSPVSRIHISPHKSSLRSTSLSSTPSPIAIASGRSSSSAVMRGRCTPQDVIPEHSDSLKSSPLISPSSSSGVFLSPASPISSCNSPIFIFRKNMSPIKQGDDSKSSVKSNSLLQSLLLTGKCPDTKPFIKDYRSDTHFETDAKDIEPLAVDVGFKFSNGENLSSFRSQSVPTLASNSVVSPSSNTLPFADSAFSNKETSALLEIKPNDLDVLDTVLKSSEEDLLIENMSDNDTLESGIHTVGNDVSMESVISNLCDFLNDKGLSGTNEHIKAPPMSRSQPNTPIIYSESSNSSRDPVVSAFAISSVSKSYPSTPTVTTTHSFNGVTANVNVSTKRNINLLLDSLSNPVSSLSDDIDLHINNFADLSTCDDAFNQLAKEVASSNTSDKEL